MAEGAGDALSLLALGDLAERAGNPAEAALRYREAYQACPDQTEPLYRLAGIFTLLNQTRALPETLATLVNPATPDQWLLLADVLTVHRQYRPALRCISRADQQGADRADTALLEAFCRLRVGDAAKAGAALAAVPPDHPLAVQATQMALLAAWCRYDCPEARRHLEALTLSEGCGGSARALHHLLCADSPLPDGPAWGQAGGELLLQAVDVLLAAGRRQEAEQAVALMDRCGWPEGYRALALLFRLRGQVRLARRYCGRALALQPDDAELLAGLAELELKARNWPKAHDLAARLAALTPDEPLPYLLRARIFRAQAVEILRLAARQGEDPEVAALLAELVAKP
ncbi:MAG TPA: tetratricopeptide repeat protein [Symbiobacteriaceae bacterium]|jgi:tetratricopeptide (TPR) repeat protein